MTGRGTISKNGVMAFLLGVLLFILAAAMWEEPRTLLETLNLMSAQLMGLLSLDDGLYETTARLMAWFLQQI